MNQSISVPEPRPVTPHGILAHRIEELYRALTTGRDREVWLPLLRDCRTRSALLEEYLLACSTPPSRNLDDLERETIETDWDQAYETGQTELRLEREMVSGKLEGQLLKMLVAISGARRILEIGSFTGYASMAMAEALPPDGQLIACEYDPFAARLARTHLDQSADGNKVDIRVGNALDTLATLAGEQASFDLVFIDADKPGYGSYFQVLLDQDLVPVGGLIAVDNTLYQGLAYAAPDATENARAIAAFNQLVVAEDRVEQVLIPIRDGLTLIRRVA